MVFKFLSNIDSLLLANDSVDVVRTFILPIIIFVLLASLIAFGLSVVSNKFGATVDDKLAKALEHMPSANCGGCGFAGCKAYCEALVAGKAELGLCKPMKSEQYNKLAAVLGKETVQGKPMMAVVHCNGGDACQTKYQYQGYPDCKVVHGLDGGNKECFTGCLGNGNCNKTCNFDAIFVNKLTNVAVVDKDKCTACGACVKECPVNIISLIPQNAKVYVACNNTTSGKATAKVCRNGCVACHICAENCPTKAITIVNNLSVIDYDKCIGCTKCAKLCPRKCIKVLA